MSEITTKTVEERVLEITGERMQQPHMAREDVLGEAREFAIIVKEDRPALEAKGVPADYFDTYDEAISFYNSAASVYATSLFDKTEYHNRWNAREKGAYAFKWFLLEELMFCTEGHPEEQKYIKAIRRGRGRRDLVCDYSDSAAFIDRNRPLLEANHFDFTLETKCKEDGAELAELLSYMSTSPEMVEEHKTLAYQAFTFMNEMTQEFRRVGQHIFRRDPERLELYKSDHFVTIGSAKAGNSESETSE